MNKKTIWISAGETSGDLHGSLLVQALKEQDSDLEFTGMGGPAMREAGLEAVIHSEQLSVMGFTEVLEVLPRILKILQKIKQKLQTTRPTAVILIDAPDFNFRVAKMAKKMGIPVIYYISPKIWAWRESRVNFIRQYVDLMLCILPFEQEFYAKHGVQVKYVGNPLVSETDHPAIQKINPLPHQVGILPGSRTKEVETLLPVFSQAAQKLSTTLPHVHFHLVQAPSISKNMIKNYWQCNLPLVIHSTDNRYKVMRSCQAIMAASGTATLETALLEVPTVVAYKFSTLTFALGKILVKVKYMSLPNLILNELVFPELLQNQATGEAIAKQITIWMREKEKRKIVLQSLQQVKQKLGTGDAPLLAAGYIMKLIG